MKFDIARQPLVPAFLTLAALAVVAMWNAGGPAVDTAVQAGHAAETVDIGRNAAGALAVSSPGELLAQFQAAHPVWARWIAGLLMLFTGMSVGRLTVRYNLYSVGTCLTIPLYGAIACWPSPRRISAVRTATDSASTPSSAPRSTSDCCRSSPRPQRRS